MTEDTNSALADELENIAACANVFRPGNSYVPVLMRRAASALRQVGKLEWFTGHVARLFDSEEQGGKVDPQDAIETLDGLISLARSAINEGLPS